MYYFLNYGVPIIFLILAAVCVIAFILSKTKKTATTMQTNSNKKDLVSSICEIAESGEGYWAISSEMGSGQHLSVFMHRPSGQSDRYGFRDHGYANLTRQGMDQLFNALAGKLQGHVQVNYEEVYGSGSDAVSSVSSPFTPGGGGSARVPIGITMYSPTAWNQKAEKERQKEEEENRYKKTF